jgi:ABC-type polysaccharide/polyol phosphate transport system ATPase subunit
MIGNQVAVAFNQVSKKYLVGEKYYPSLRDWVATFFSKEFFKGKKSFYALKDLSFEVRKGESVGFIGPNGAGKSTILKLISRITVPTSGEIGVNGKVAGLLELGAGFHPELTGRENIYFQGAILGMDKRQIEELMGKIIRFSGLRSFIDSPVKHYSSGMHARLGFSVAIHLDPEILLIDEVLAVGDAEFRKKCHKRIESFFKDGNKTVILVAHNLGMIEKLCQRAYWLDRGKLVEVGEPGEVIGRYLKKS